MASGRIWKLILMLSIKNLPLWAKSLVAPAVVLLAMFAMAGTAFVNLANQKADVANLDSVAFEGLRQAMVATEAVTDFQTELYHLSSTAANESDHSKVEAAATRLPTRLDAIAPQIKAVAAREGVRSHRANVRRLRLGGTPDDRVHPARCRLRRDDDGLRGGYFCAASARADRDIGACAGAAQ